MESRVVAHLAQMGELVQKALLGFAAGVMIAASVWSLLIPAIENAEAQGMNVTNSKLAYAFAASDKGAAESFKKLFDQVQSGNTAVFYDKKLLNADGSRAWDAFLGNV